MKNNEQGFTLIEVLIAVSIFAIGLLATAQMQWTAMRGNFRSRGLTEAATLAQSKIDELRMINWDLLTDANGDGMLGNSTTMTAATATDGSDPPVSIYGNVYTIRWNVVNDVPVADSRLVRVFVIWNEGAEVRRYTTDFVRNELY